MPARRPRPFSTTLVLGLLLAANLYTGVRSAEKPAAEKPAAEAKLEYRTWTDRTGKFKIFAAFLSYENKQVRLKKKADGAVIAVPLDRLSTADRERLVKYLKSGGKQWVDPAEVAAADKRPTDKALADLLGEWQGKNRQYRGKLTLYADDRATCSVLGGGGLQIMAFQVDYAADGKSCKFSEGTAKIDKGKLYLTLTKQVFIGGISQQVELNLVMRRTKDRAAVEKELKDGG